MNQGTTTRLLGGRFYEARMILIMLLVLIVLIALGYFIRPEEFNFFVKGNLQNNGRRVALLSIYAIGGGLAIITAGIDLSVGSVIGLTALLMPLLVMEWHIPGTDHLFPVGLAIPVVLLVGAALGFFHGILIAKCNLQAFIITLCGLLVYRGVARTITGDISKGFGASHEAARNFAIGTLKDIVPSARYVPVLGDVPIAVFLMVGVAVAVGIFLHMTVWGRHLYALGQNEEAARYSGISVARLKIVAYTLSGLLASIAGVLYALEINSVQPSDAGKGYELYGIAAAVLGGCSLRGGEGTVVGIVAGAIVLTVLHNLINLTGLSTLIEDAVIGAVILGMVTVDEVVKRRAGRRATAK